MPEERNDEATLDDVISKFDDDFSSGKGDEETPAASTETSSTPDETGDTVTDTEKTEETPEETGGEGEGEEIPKEFHKHPAWQRILRQREEARQKAEELEERLAALEEAARKPEPEPEDKSSFEDALARELGYDPEALTDEERQSLKGIMTIAEKIADKIVTEKVKPIEQVISQAQAQATVQQNFDAAKELAGEEGIDWEKEALPAMEAFLKKRPKDERWLPLDLYKEATRGLLTGKALKAKEKAKASEVDAKKRARPLIPAGNTGTPKKTYDYSDEGIDELIDDFDKTWKG